MKNSICKIDNKEYDFQEVVKLLIAKQEWKAKETIVELVGCEYRIATNILTQIKNNNNEIPFYIDPNIRPDIISNQNKTEIVVTCPYCKSSNTKKISNASRIGSIALWGIFSKKIQKQWHCNSCGSDF